jgi:hypothetical protein
VETRKARTVHASKSRAALRLSTQQAGKWGSSPVLSKVNFPAAKANWRNYHEESDHRDRRLCLSYHAGWERRGAGPAERARSRAGRASERMVDVADRIANLRASVSALDAPQSQK